jgi:ribonuclease HI
MTKSIVVEKNDTTQTVQNQSKIKILNEGDNCRKCKTPVIRKQTKKKAIKPNQAYYFDYYLFCPSCKTMYMVEEAKRYGSSRENGLFS